MDKTVWLFFWDQCKEIIEMQKKKSGREKVVNFTFSGT